MNYEFTVPGEQVPLREFVWRVPVMRPVMPPDYPYDANMLPPRFEEVARAVVSFDGERVTVRLQPSAYTMATDPRIILRALMPVPPSLRDAREMLSLALDALRHPKAREK